MSKKKSSKKPKPPKTPTEVIHAKRFNDGTQLEAVFVGDKPKFLLRDAKSKTVTLVEHYLRDALAHHVDDEGSELLVVGLHAGKLCT